MEQGSSKPRTREPGQTLTTCNISSTLSIFDNYNGLEKYVLIGSRDTNFCERLLKACKPKSISIPIKMEFIFPLLYFYTFFFNKYEIKYKYKSYYGKAITY